MFSPMSIAASSTSVFTRALVVGLAIPISIVGTFLVLKLLGRSLNVVSLAGMVEDSAMTPSARPLDELASGGSSFFEYAISMARSHSEYFASITPMSALRHDEFQAEAADSVRRQAEIEAGDSISFEEYLANYYASE